MSTSASVVVAICTFRRNDQLLALLQRIDQLAPSEVPAGSVAITVVDDSPEGGARAITAAAHDSGSLEIAYFNTASANIAIARNTAIEESMTRGAFVACLDDDCVPEPGWLRELLQVADSYNADIVVGHRSFFAGHAAPAWLSSEPFLEENVLHPDGSVPESGNTANVLLRSLWLEQSGVRFRAELGKVGGEDMVFFADATAVRAEIRFAAKSITNEPCDGVRATFRYQLWRQVWLGNNEAAINRATEATPSARLLLRGLKRIVVGATHPVLMVFRRRSPQWRWGLAFSGRGIGLMVGVLGVRLRHRS